MKKSPEQLYQLIEAGLAKLDYGSRPSELYGPIAYLMNLGGKRLRPLLTLIAYSIFKDNPEEITNQAMAVEVFHNFTLMHDDIMDEAPLRRGEATVHEKWDSNTAILSGDVMMVKAYELMAGNNPYLAETLAGFNKCATEVCEGQQLDMVFESRSTVEESEYIEMIKLKTAVLLGFSLELGGIMAAASKRNKHALKELGINIGIGFQLKDDLLDVYADKSKFGKQVGGDIIANKKTYLLINALNIATGATKKELKKWLSAETFDIDEKVNAVTTIYNDLGIKQKTQHTMNHYFDLGFADLKKVKGSIAQKAVLRHFAEKLIDRDN